MNPCVYKRPLFISLLLLIAGICLFYHPVPGKNDISNFISKNPVTVQGRVESFAVEKPTSYNVIVKAHQINGQKASGRLYLRSAQMAPEWKDEISFKGTLKEPFGVDLLGNFNWRRYLTYKNVFTQINTREVAVVKPAAWPYRCLRRVRASILETFEDHFPSPLHQIAAGILLGERGDLDPALFTAFQDSGAIHLLVASGGNVGFVTLLTLLVCSFFFINRRRALVLALLTAGFYTLLAGADAPLLRAYFMTVCAVSGYLLGRNSGVFQGLVLSCFLILLFHPAALFETGFQMSFLATFAIVLVMNNYSLPSHWPKSVRFFAQIFLATLATQLALLPIFTNVFYKVSLAGLLANMLLVPLASFLLGISFIYYVAELLHIGFLFYFPTLWGLKLFAFLVNFFASFSFSSIAAVAWAPGTVVAYYTGLFLLFQNPASAFFRKLWKVCFGIMLLCLIWNFVDKKPTKIYLLNEYYKNVVIVKAPQGQTFVVGDEIKADKIKDTLCRIGRKEITGLLHFSNRAPKVPLRDYVKVAQEIFPFTEKIWPGDTLLLGDTPVSVHWGLSSAQDGALTPRRGYSGSKEDSVSYCFENIGHPFCIGAHGKFVQIGPKIIFSQKNQTTFLKI